MKTEVKFNLPRDIEAEIGDDIKREFGVALEAARDDVIGRYAVNGSIPSALLGEIVEQGQRSVLSVIDSANGKLVLSHQDGDAFDDVITIEMHDGLAEHFFGNVNS